MSRRRHRLLAICILVLICLVPAVPAPAQRAPESPKPVALVRIPFPQEDGSLTPYTFELGYGLMSLVYDTLFWRDVDGVPQPLLAKSLEISPDGRRLTLRLAEGLRWHDGTPLTSADVAFTFRYVKDHPHSRFTPQVGVVERVGTPDPSTVAITLRHPSAGFADQPLADLPILPAHVWEALLPGQEAPEGLPMGSGPYRLVEHRQGESYRFEANAGYFLGPPMVSVLEVPIIGSAEDTFRALERRRVDVVPLNLPAEAAERLRGLGTRLIEGPAFLGTVLALNVRQPPFDRVEMRQAISRSLDLDRIAGAVGNTTPADRGYVHPQSRWAPSTTVHVFDHDRARQVMAAGAGDPVTVLAPDNDPVKLEAARQVTLALARVGARSEVKKVTSAELSKALGEQGDPPAFQAAITTTPSLGSYDPDHLAWLFPEDSGNGARNVTGFRSLAFDTLTARVAVTVDVEARRAAVAELLRLLDNDAPAVPLFFSGGAFAYRPDAYSSWVFVKGSGILNKRSFLQAGRPPAAPPRATAVDDGTGDDGTTEEAGGFPVWIAAAGSFGIAGVLAAVGLLRRRW